MNKKYNRIQYKHNYDPAMGVCNCPTCKSNDGAESIIRISIEEYMSLFNKDENLKKIASLKTENSFLKEIIATNNSIMQKYKEVIQAAREDNNKLENQIAELTAQLDLYRDKKEN